MLATGRPARGEQQSEIARQLHRGCTALIRVASGPQPSQRHLPTTPMYALAGACEREAFFGPPAAAGDADEEVGPVRGLQSKDGVVGTQTVEQGRSASALSKTVLGLLAGGPSAPATGTPGNPCHFMPGVGQR